MKTGEFKLTDTQMEWLEYIAKQNNVDKDVVMRNFLNDVLNAYDEENLVSKFGVDDGLTRTRVGSGKYADADGDLNSGRIPEELYNILKDGMLLYIRTNHKGVYNIKRIKIISFGVYKISYMLDSKNATKVYEIAGDKAADRFVDEYGTPYVHENFEKMYFDVMENGGAKYAECVWTDSSDYKTVVASKHHASAVLKSVISMHEREGFNIKTVRVMRYVYTIINKSAHFNRLKKLRDKPKHVVAYENEVKKAEVILRSFSNKSSGNKSKSKKKEKGGILDKVLNVFRD